MSGQESLIEELIVVLILFVFIFSFFFFAPKKNKKTKDSKDINSIKKSEHPENKIR